ncbi:MAG: NAD(P)H-dependent oxidoreductase [Proteobacteria bacterium]|nr:NAD(P)H-dependent oxidoreductase [Pseudomonadota bacterium]
MNVLALCGSLRAASLNAMLLRACARLAQPGIGITIFDGMGRLPLFNPDLDEHPPEPVGELRTAVEGSRALLIASPEYAHGVSGTIKNALDWLVSFPPFVGLPVAVLNASPRARHAREALIETLATMSATVVTEACIAVPLLGAGLDEERILQTPRLADDLRRALSHLAAASGRTGVPPPQFPVR